MKIFLALAAVASMAFAGQPMSNPTITIKPIPPIAGGKVTISYTGTPGTKLTLDWDPASEPSTVVVDENGNAEVTVPERATSLIVDDPTGGAKPVSTMIQQH